MKIVRPILQLSPLALLLIATVATARSANPPDSRTGAPRLPPAVGNELTCAGAFCHDTFALNSGPGAVAIVAPPMNYVPGEVLEILLAVAQEGQSRWGFEMTAIDSGLESVGTFVPIDGTTQVSQTGGREFVKHTSLGSAPGQPNLRVFAFNWEAPETDAGEVTFYAVGNAANSNGSRFGDYIYSTNVTLPEPGSATMGRVALAVLALASASRVPRSAPRRVSPFTAL